jgi:hypothetical protein
VSIVLHALEVSSRKCLRGNSLDNITTYSNGIKSKCSRGNSEECGK